jgi:hypothetical protein
MNGGDSATGEAYLYAFCGRKKGDRKGRKDLRKGRKEKK